MPDYTNRQMATIIAAASGDRYLIGGAICGCLGHGWIAAILIAVGIGWVAYLEYKKP